MHICVGGGVGLFFNGLNPLPLTTGHYPRGTTRQLQVTKEGALNEHTIVDGGETLVGEYALNSK